MAELPGAPQRIERRTRTAWKYWAVGGLVILLAIFIGLNSQKVTIDFLVGETEMPLVFGLLVSGLLGVVIGWAGTRLRDHRKDRLGRVPTHTSAP